MMTLLIGILMRFLSLNVRVFGGSLRKLSLKSLLKRVKPTIILLQETMVNGGKVREALTPILKYRCICNLGSKGLSYGLCSTWNPIKSILMIFFANVSSYPNVKISKIPG